MRAVWTKQRKVSNAIFKIRKYKELINSKHPAKINCSFVFDVADAGKLVQTGTGWGIKVTMYLMGWGINI